MSSLCTPEIESIMERLTANIEKQRLVILRLEFYMYMEKQGYKFSVWLYIPYQVIIKLVMGFFQTRKRKKI